MGKQRNEIDLLIVQNGSAINGITAINKVNIGNAQESNYAESNLTLKLREKMKPRDLR